TWRYMRGEFARTPQPRSSFFGLRQVTRLASARPSILPASSRSRRLNSSPSCAARSMVAALIFSGSPATRSRSLRPRTGDLPAAAGARHALAPDGDGEVVADVERQLRRARLHQLRDGDVLPAQVWRVQDQAGALLDHAGDADARSTQLAERQARRAARGLGGA